MVLGVSNQPLCSLSLASLLPGQLYSRVSAPGSLPAQALPPINIANSLQWERINSKKSTPNKNIVFIKPLPGPLENISKDYLERIAAQCLPIMNKHYLAVVSLEEYEPNREFWGKLFRCSIIVNDNQIQILSSSSWRLEELIYCRKMFQ